MAQATTVERLTTGSMINSGKDNPAGLIALSSLNSDLNVIGEAIKSGERADAVLGIADKALNEVSSLLGEIETLAAASTSTGGLSDSEIAANQASIDSALESIDRIVRSTNYNGKRLLDGSQGITRTGVDDTKVTDLRVFSRRSASTSTSVQVDVQTAATRGEVGIASAVASQDTVISIAGTKGVATVNIGSGQTLSAVATNISAAAAETGVDARVSGSTLYVRTTDYGDDEFVTVDRVSGSTNFGDSTDTGSDAVVAVNGQQASVDGLKINYNQNGVSLNFNMTTAFNVAASTETFSVTTGGATFQLGTDSTSRATIGVDSLASFRLGSSLDGYLTDIRSGGSTDLNTDAASATKIARTAKSMVADQQGRIGGFQKFQVNPAIASLTAAQESITKVSDVIGATDFAVETAELNRQQVLQQAGIALLGVTNQQVGSILSLL
jgi:flagellin